MCWGGDIAGGTNLSLLVSPSDEALGGLSLVLEPAEAAGGSRVCVCVWGGVAAWVAAGHARRVKSCDGARVA